MNDAPLHAQKPPRGPDDGIHGERRRLGLEGDEEIDVPHLYLFEPGWKVALKTDNDRAYCYVMAPGQDFYHRLNGGEIHLIRGDEKVCLACAGRRGLLSFQPRLLRDAARGLDPGPSPSDSELPIDFD